MMDDVKTMYRKDTVRMNKEIKQLKADHKKEIVVLRDMIDEHWIEIDLYQKEVSDLKHKLTIRESTVRSLKKKLKESKIE